MPGLEKIVMMMIFVISATETWRPCQVGAVPVPPADSSTSTPGYKSINSAEAKPNESNQQNHPTEISTTPKVYWNTIATQITNTESAYKHPTRQKSIYEVYEKEQEICKGGNVCYTPDIPIPKSYIARYGHNKLNSHQESELILELHHGLQKIICYFEKIANAESHHHKTTSTNPESHHHKVHLLREFEREVIKLGREVADELKINPSIPTYKEGDCQVPEKPHPTATGIIGWEVIQRLEQFIKEWAFIVKNVRRVTQFCSGS